MLIVKNANLALAFLLELFMLVAFGYWGFQTESGTLVKFVLGLGTPLVAIIFWGIFMAPRSSRRVAKNTRLVLQSIIFGLAAVCLLLAEQPVWALGFVVVSVINMLLIYIWKQ